GVQTCALPILLVVDDSAFTRMALTRMIESDPALCVTETAQSGREALEKIASLHPDVVTLDIEMPGMNGLETLKRIMREFPCSVIMVSSLSQEGAETTLEALAWGAFDYVPKQLSGTSLDIVRISEDLIAQSGCREQSPCSDENPLARGCCTSEEYRDGGRSCFPRHCCSWHIDGWSPSSSGNPAAAAG